MIKSWCECVIAVYIIATRLQGLKQPQTQKERLHEMCNSLADQLPWYHLGCEDDCALCWQLCGYQVKVDDSDGDTQVTDHLSAIPCKALFA